MKDTILNLLSSPITGKDFELDVFEYGAIYNKDKQIISGKLFRDGEEYPIINGVPRILKRDLLLSALDRYPDFIKKYGSKFNFHNENKDEKKDNLKKKTLESFGIQWNYFPEMYEIWQENFMEYINPHISKEDFKDKSILDCGCGFGRHLYYAAKFGAKIAIGIDISHSVDAAARNVSEFSNAHVIQADIYNIPLPSNFDIVYSIGVLQHTPDPVKAFQSIFGKLLPGGKVFAWIYGKRPKLYHVVIDSLRKVTVNFNPKLLYYITFLLAVVSFTLFVLPRRLFAAVGLEKIGEKIPFSGYAKYPFRVSHADWYDRLAAPKTEYFDEKFPQKLLESINSINKEISFREGGSWRLFGEKAG
jgi:SAM-dependent methyltransferase